MACLENKLEPNYAAHMVMFLKTADHISSLRCIDDTQSALTLRRARLPKSRSPNSSRFGPAKVRVPMQGSSVRLLLLLSSSLRVGAHVTNVCTVSDPAQGSTLYFHLGTYHSCSRSAPGTFTVWPPGCNDENGNSCKQAFSSFDTCSSTVRHPADPGSQLLSSNCDSGSNAQVNCFYQSSVEGGSGSFNDPLGTSVALTNSAGQKPYAWPASSSTFSGANRCTYYIKVYSTSLSSGNFRTRLSNTNYILDPCWNNNGFYAHSAGSASNMYNNWPLCRMAGSNKYWNFNLAVPASGPQCTGSVYNAILNHRICSTGSSNCNGQTDPALAAQIDSSSYSGCSPTYAGLLCNLACATGYAFQGSLSCSDSTGQWVTSTETPVSVPLACIGPPFPPQSPFPPPPPSPPPP